MSRKPWSRDELVLAMNLYCQLPFGRLHARNPEVIRLAQLLGRTPSSVGMKLCNFASLDPVQQERGVRGLSSVSRGDRQVWQEFHNDWTDLAAESERLRISIELTAPEPKDTSNVLEATAQADEPELRGETERAQSVKVRLAQRFFRRSVLASYDSRCCVSDIPVRCMLIASHILPWSDFPEHRADPRNGLCLSRLHDAAFDRGLISFDADYRLLLSPSLRQHFSNQVLRDAFHRFEGKPLRLPNKFRPDAKFLARHRETIFHA